MKGKLLLAVSLLLLSAAFAQLQTNQPGVNIIPLMALQGANPMNPIAPALPVRR